MRSIVIQMKTNNNKDITNTFFLITYLIKTNSTDKLNDPLVNHLNFYLKQNNKKMFFNCKIKI